MTESRLSQDLIPLLFGSSNYKRKQSADLEIKMSSRRANGSKHPSVVEKIHGQPYLFTKYFSSKSFTSGIQFHCSGSPYLNGGQHNPLLPACQMASSVLIPPQVFVGQPTEKRNVPTLTQFLVGLSNIVNMTAAAPIGRVLSCAFESHFKSIRGYYKIDKDGFWKWFASISLAGGLASATYSFFTHPLYYAQTRLANDIKTCRESKRQFNGLVDVCKKTLRSDGIAGIYRGCNVSVLEGILRDWALTGIIKATSPWLLLGLLGLRVSRNIRTYKYC
ncbi:ADP,ATP carrier protein 3, mitochondrial-like [Tripterygium wilfordii]|uniref:ADP,ATP carrier protein 3, mitochondrial-like n=1 Tax=Tripterygium wilfordii TaxID=458696 RepID=UPI0018F80598|nr:ADP,ATP carrier protein 3, mitochondrial-like [Tripterygium wilfordii]